MVDSLCDTRMMLFLLFCSASDFKIMPSLMESTLLVGSSNKMSWLPFKNARASPIRCKS